MLTLITVFARRQEVDPALPRLLHEYARQAVEAGHGEDGWARIVELLRAKAV